MAKTGLAAIAQGRTDLFHMDPQKIVIRHGWNSRDFELPENQAHVDQLAESIREVGVKEPLSGYHEEGEFILTNGESRFRAILKLISEGHNVETVPVQPEPRHATEAEHVLSQIIRNSGKPFTPIENARVFARLIGLGMTNRDIAAKVGMTPERVAQIAKLDSVTPTVREHIKKGEITSTLVQRIQSKAKDANEVEEQVVEAIKTAQADGKKKATPKHAAPRKAIPKRANYKDLFLEMMSFIDDGELSDYAEGDAFVTQLTIPEDRWEAFQAAAKPVAPKPAAKPTAAPLETF
jgi:ParB/RepB/Spo0J family partition protein